MLDRVAEIQAEAEAAIGAAAGSAELEELRVRYLGRKAELTTILRGIAELPAEERGNVGGGANRARKALEQLLERRAGEVDAAELEVRLASDRIDVTLPGAPVRPAGHLHLITRTTRQIEDVMIGLGYRVVEGPEIEHDYYNFTALNHPPGHPARMLQDTFYIQSHPELLLRTHTSPVQIRSMETQPPPIFVIVPGKVYRRDSDATHSPMFHQVEGLAIGEGITLADRQPLDLVEHRAVGGVGVAPVDLARDDHEDRRRLRLHRADLHRRGVGAQQQLGVRLDVEGVLEHPRRVSRRMVERGEVVVVVLDLRPLDHPVAEADHHVLDLPRGAGDQVQICLLYTSPSPRDGLLS